MTGSFFPSLSIFSKNKGQNLKAWEAWRAIAIADTVYSLVQYVPNATTHREAASGLFAPISEKISLKQLGS